MGIGASLTFAACGWEGTADFQEDIKIWKHVSFVLIRVFAAMLGLSSLIYDNC